MTRVVGTPLRVTEFSSPSDEAVSARVSGDNVPRIRIDAGGRLTWGDGSLSGDTKLYRSSASALMLEGELTASLGIATRVVSGSPAFYMPNGSILVDEGNEALYFRVNNQWIAAGTGQGNSSITVSDTPPAGAESGDLWYESDSGKTFVYYDSFWVEVGGGGATGVATDLSELGDVALSTLANGDVLRYNSSASVWTNDPINLSTDTVGDYVASLTAGTGVTVSNNSGEGSSPTVSIGQAVGTTSSVQFAAVTAPLVGNADTATKLETSRTIQLSGDVSGSVSFDGSANASITTTIQPNSVALGTDTTGNYMSGVSAGTGIAVSHTPGEGSTATISIESTAWTSYNPTITADGGGFALNNGTLTGRYKQVGKTVFFNLKFVFGSTTNAGTGHWNFSLPVTAYDSNFTFSAAILDDGVAWYGGIGNGNYTGSTSSFAVIIPGTNASVTTWASVGNGGPFIWGAADNITISGSYEAA